MGGQSSAAALEDARKKRTDKGAGSAVIAILRYSNEFEGPWVGDAIPLAAAGHRVGMSPELAAEVLGHNPRFVVDEKRRLIWEAGDRSDRGLKEAVVPEGEVEWMGTNEQ